MIYEIAPLAEVKAKFSSFLKSSENGPVIVTKNGKPVAAIIAIGEDEDIERLLMAYSPKLQKILNDSWEEYRKTGGIPHDEFWKSIEEDSQDQGAT